MKSKCPTHKAIKNRAEYWRSLGEYEAVDYLQIVLFHKDFTYLDNQVPQEKVPPGNHPTAHRGGGVAGRGNLSSPPSPFLLPGGAEGGQGDGVGDSLERISINVTPQIGREN